MGILILRPSLFVLLVATFLMKYSAGQGQPSSQPSQQPTSQPTTRISSKLKNGLVAYYPFDGNADDNSGNGNHGVVHGGASLVADRFGNPKNAYSFDGNSGYIEVAGQQFNFASNMSFSVWVKYTVDNSAFKRVLDKCTFNNGGFRAGWDLVVFTDPNQFYSEFFSASDVQNFTPRISLTKGQWNCVVFTKSGLVGRLYLNGIIVQSFSFGNSKITNNGNCPLLIGAQCGGSSGPLSNVNSFFAGSIDDIFIYNRTLSDLEASALYGFDSPTSQPTTQPTIRISSYLKNGLVAYYPFDGKADDNSGNGNHGVIHGGVSLVTDRFGTLKNAYSFDGNSGYIEVAGQQFNFNNNLSVSLWVKPLSPVPFSRMVDKCTYNNGVRQGGWGVSLAGNSSTVSFFFSSPGGDQNSLFGPILKNRWTHVVVVKQYNRGRVYFDGLLVVSLTLGSTQIISNGNMPLLFGAACHTYSFPVTNLGDWFNGIIDDVALFNRTLTPSEVTRLYQLDSPTSRPSSQPSRQPITQPSSQPSLQPSQQPTTQPTVRLSSSLKNGLVAYYPFDGNADDNSGNGNHGVIHGGVSLVADRFGTTKNAYSFDGTSGYIEVAGQQLNFVNNMSISFWINPASHQLNWTTVLDKSGRTTQLSGQFFIQQYEGRQNRYLFCFTTTIGIGPCSAEAQPFQVVPDTWSHVALIKTNQYFKAYINSVLVVTSVWGVQTILSNGNLPLIIGGRNYAGTIPATIAYFLKAKLDDIFVFNRSLTFREVQALAQFDSPTSQPSTQPTSQPTVRLSSSLKKGLVAYWPFDGNADDNSGNGNHGMVHGGVSLVTDRFGNPKNAFSFDGNSGYIEVAGQQLNFVNNMSISFWINPASFQGNWTRILDKTGYSAQGFHGQYFIEQVGVRQNQYVFCFSTTVGVGRCSDDQPFQVLPDAWSHVAVIKTNQYYKAYINSVLVATSMWGVQTTLSNGNLPLIIGGSNAAATIPATVSYFLKAKLDDIFIFNRSLTVREVQAFAQFDSPTSQPSSQPTSQPTVRLSSSLKNGLVAYYPFDGNPDDNSGTGNHGVVHGGVSLVADRFGNPKNAYSFDGNSGYIEVAGQQFNFPNNMSVSLWVKPLNPLSWTRMIDKCTYNNGGFQGGWAVSVGANSSTAAFFFRSSGGERDSQVCRILKNQWNHLVLVKENNRGRFYLNGLLAVSFDFGFSQIISNGNMPLLFGVSCHTYSFPVTNVGDHFNGIIDDVALFNRTLTLSEVTRLYQLDSPTSQPSRQPTTQPTSQPTVRVSSSLKNGLVAYYPFDGNADDNSGNGNHGVVHGGATLVTDRFGNSKNAYSFDGTSGYIEVAGQQFNFVNNMSISFWINPTPTQTDWYNILNKSLWNGTMVGGFSLHQNSGLLNNITFCFTHSANSGYCSEWHQNELPSVHLKTNCWNHFVLTKSNDLVTVFLDTKVVLTTHLWFSTIKSNQNLPLMIGAANSGVTFPATRVNGYFRGSIDELMLFNRVISAKEMQSIYVFDSPTSQPSGQPTRQPSSQPSIQPSSQPTTEPTVRLSSSLKNGLVAYYPFDGNADDNSGNGNHGVVHGGASLVADRFGNSKNAYSFDGSSSYIEVAGQQFNFVNNISISFWINPASLQRNWAIMVDKTGYTTQPDGQFYIEQVEDRQNQYMFCFTHTFGQFTCSENQLFQVIPDTWSHVALIKTNQYFKAYINSVLVVTSVWGVQTILSNGNFPLIIGGRNYAGTIPAAVGQFFKGTLDDMFIFNRSLTVPEVQALSQFDSPTSQPSIQPTVQPTCQPSRQPSGPPTSQPSCQPSVQPFGRPSSQPSRQPSRTPTTRPSRQPSAQPTTQPSSQPSVQPSSQPSSRPTKRPSTSPSTQPTSQPSGRPSNQPTFQPSTRPSEVPSSQPSDQPSVQPTTNPSGQPSSQPSSHPSSQPSCPPTSRPTAVPRGNPSTIPSQQPSSHPSNAPSESPSGQPMSPSGHFFPNFPTESTTDWKSFSSTEFPARGSSNESTESSTNQSPFQTTHGSSIFTTHETTIESTVQSTDIQTNFFATHFQSNSGE
jgi:hypothetical protein